MTSRLGAVIDITETKRAEEKIRLSERELRTIVAIMPAYVGTSLPDGTVDFLSQTWLDYCKRPAFLSITHKLNSDHDSAFYVG
jgi:PAS domain-containing protein